MTTPHARRNTVRLSRLLFIGITTSLLGILAGIVPDFTAQQPSLIFSNAARADEFSDTDLRNYAAALMQIEPLRQSTLAQVSRANNGSLPNLVCNQPNTMEALNSEARSLFIRYCNQCESIAASRGLSIERFNQITQAVRSNPQLQNRVRSFMN
ncbi:DUF4168 domain-containing protein [Chamaesiphon polymorphus]|uniref:DUF4168 domain-containing protein n=1 Tax=Chamaesiphon polymorphus CCALA 037 TaxID=2107692 RepID=A0A2T1F630_9CYAN|nr:DUF4168 domain-containing protein [Chamaesiphon polymorphus]PSB40414.1 hypothetical protein C7B77_28380 [Chamaesiphon polymorphus CCALA 037]